MINSFTLWENDCGVWSWNRNQAYLKRSITMCNRHSENLVRFYFLVCEWLLFNAMRVSDHMAVCEFSHKSDANGLWNLLGTCEIWHEKVLLARDYFSCVTLISFSVICRDRWDWSKKHAALLSNKSLARNTVLVFYDSLVSRDISFLFPLCWLVNLMEYYVSEFLIGRNGKGR